MKNASKSLFLLALAVGLILFGRATPALGAEEDRSAAGERLERLERRINELAQQQDQLMHRLGAPGPGPGPDGFRQQPVGGAQPGHIGSKAAQDLAGLFKLMVLVGLLCNILLAVWIFTDIRRRGEGPGILIVVALFAGIPAAIIYALVRIGDRKV